MEENEEYNSIRDFKNKYEVKIDSKGDIENNIQHQPEDMSSSSEISEKEPNYEAIIEESILQKKKINISKMSEEEKKSLQECYMNMMKEIEKGNPKYLKVVIECISKHPENDRIVKNYKDIQEEYEKYKNDSVMKLGALARQKTAIEVIINAFKDIIPKNIDWLIEKDDRVK